MFNKNNTKIKPESEFLASAKLHTMKDDIAGENNATLNVKNEIDNKPEELPEVKGESPFFNNVASQADDLNAVKNDEEIAPKEEVKTKGFPNFERINEENNSMGKAENNEMYEIFEQTSEKKHTFFYVTMVLLILLLGGGGYYFWFMGGEKNVNEIIFNLTGKKDFINLNYGAKDIGVNPGVINDLSDNKGGFSEKVNFMVIEDENLNEAGIKSAIDDKFIEMEEYTDGQLEFLIVDQSNKPLAFKDFVENFNLILGPEIMNNISGDSFSLFLYKKGDIKRLNLVVNVKNEDLLRMSLAKSEKTLANNLKSLFMYAQPDPSVKNPFGESNYNGQLVRYVNLNKNPDLSLDYSIVGNYLIIATNKESGRLIIDKLSRESTPNEDVFSPED